MGSAHVRYLLFLGVLCLALLAAACNQAAGLLPPTPTAATPLVYHSPTPTAPRPSPTRAPILTPSPAVTFGPTRAPAPTVAPARPLLPTPIQAPFFPITPTPSPTATGSPTPR